MSVGRKLNELQVEAEQLGLDINTMAVNGKWEGRSKPGKASYTKLLGKYYLEKRRSEGRLTKGAEWVFNNLDSPNLAISPTQAKPEMVDEFHNSLEAMVSVKEDGLRCTVVYYPEEGFTFFSRNKSVQDYLTHELTGKIAGFEDGFKGVFKHAFVLDGEMVSTNPNIIGRMATETQLAAVTALMSLETQDSLKVQYEYGCPIEFRFFDCIMWDEKNLFDQPYSRRFEALKKILSAIAERAE